VRIGEGNPPGNALPAGVTEVQVAEAVSKSGYPLQCVASRLLRDDSFWVQEEWSYVDRDSGELRTLDLHAGLDLWDWDGPQPRVTPHLDLLIECKQSDLPYVFFLCPSVPPDAHFPLFAGLCHNEEVAISTDDDRSVWNLPLAVCLGLRDHAFVAAPPACSTIFTKCQRKGKRLEVSGSEPFNGLVLPLSKGMAHFQRSQAPVATRVYFDCHLVLAVGVLDAPMVAAAPGGQHDELAATPWVRVFRHEAAPGGPPGRLQGGKILALDIVHKEFFQDYIRSFVLPFARLFSERALKHDVELAEGKAFASAMGRDWWTGVEGRLRPRTLATTLAWARAVGGNVAKALRELTRRT